MSTRTKHLVLLSCCLYLLSFFTHAAILKVEFISEVEYLREVYHDGNSIQTRDVSIYVGHPTTISIGDTFTSYAIIDTDTPPNNFKPCCSGDRYYDFFNAINRWEFTVNDFSIGKQVSNDILALQDGADNEFRPDVISSVHWVSVNSFDYVMDWKMQNRFEDVISSYSYIPENLTTEMFREFYSSANLYNNLGTDQVSGVSFGSLNSSFTIQNLSVVSEPVMSVMFMIAIMAFYARRALGKLMPFAVYD